MEGMLPHHMPGILTVEAHLNEIPTAEDPLSETPTPEIPMPETITSTGLLILGQLRLLQAMELQQEITMEDPRSKLLCTKIHIEQHMALLPSGPHGKLLYKNGPPGKLVCKNLAMPDQTTAAIRMQSCRETLVTADGTDVLTACRVLPCTASYTGTSTYIQPFLMRLVYCVERTLPLYYAE